MADWTNIPDTDIEPDAPLKSETAFAWRDNPIAIAQAAPGAPRIWDEALSTVVTGAGVAWVGTRAAALSFGDVGAIGFFTVQRSAQTWWGEVVAASLLLPTNAHGETGYTTPLPAGSWRCLGFTPTIMWPPDAATDRDRKTTLFQRVA